MTSAISRYLISLDRRRKVPLVLLMDAGLIVLSAYLAIALRLSEVDLRQYWSGLGLSLLLLLPVGTALSVTLSIPWISTRAFSLHGTLRLAGLALVLGGLHFAINYWFFSIVPRSAPLIFIPILIVASVGARLIFGELLENWTGRQAAQERVLIYGAGAAGMQLANALRNFSGAEAVGFIDDNPAMRRVLIGPLRVYSPEEVGTLVRSRNVTQIILAMPSAPRSRKQEILRALQTLPVTLRTLPHFVDFISGQSLAEQLQTVTSEDLLGRLPQSLDMPEISASYAGLSVMVTGAGGSIGSELCLQLAAVPVRKLVLYEHSEVALYNVERRLRASGVEAELVPVLGSVLDKALLKKTLREQAVETVLHAAAYKHVPLVEQNEIAGARNNALGTRLVAQICGEQGVSRFILISTDKAVRPTNVMGATKRFAEMLVQDLQPRYPGTIFSMVRFGNVLGSSGSVIPLFREQIAKGGPLTVTHPEVTRFFMTIGEAARLVLLAGTFAKGGEVYVLDMGAPVRIADLARNMITFCGLTERTPEAPDGDISIEFIGLRPGEKLYEELLIGENQIATPHPKIMCAREGHMSPEATVAALKQLEAAIAGHDPAAIRALFLETVDGYTNGTVS